VAILFGILAALSFALYIWQFVLGVRFQFNQDSSPTSFPGISILKPLKGGELETEACLRTWLEQDYPGPVQILFGVASENDPAVNLVRNRLSDADVAVPTDFLKRIAAFYETERPVVASCLYRLSGATNIPMRLETFMVNSDFWSQVLQSIALQPMKFALGATMIITRAELAVVGGFRSIADYLADDFQLGNRATGKVALCPMAVECRSSPMTWRQVWSHQTRWARTIRVCQPGPFFFSILSNPTIWPLAWALAGAWLPALVMIVLRSLGGAALEWRFTRKFHASSIILAPFSDILRAIFWLLAFAGNRIHWGERWFRVSHGGKLTPETTGG
jgi:ceramide glucosyltransferase